jgi:hypothetical protein
MADELSYIHGDIEQAFRWTVYHVKGYKRGNLQDAHAEAIKLYIEKYQDEVPPMPKRVINP